MKFIKLTTIKNPIFILSNSVISIRRSDNETFITLSNGNYELVKESPEEIMEMIKEEKK